MPRSSGLGKGLSSIIPTAELSRESDTSGDTTRRRSWRTSRWPSIRPNPHQPRMHFDEQSLLELSSSIAEMGVLQPILVRPVDDGGFELVAGERRWRAAQRAGMTTIPAIVRTTDDLRSIEQALVENLHRQDLTPLEEAAAYQQLIEDFQLTHEQLSSRVGKSRSAITNTIRLLGLPPAVQHLLADGQLSAGHARALLGTPDRELQERLARQAVDHGWSVRAIEQAVRDGGVESPAASSSGARDRAAAGTGDGHVDRRCRPHPTHEVATARPARTGGSPGGAPRHPGRGADERHGAARSRSTSPTSRTSSGSSTAWCRNRPQTESPRNRHLDAPTLTVHLTFRGCDQRHVIFVSTSPSDKRTGCVRICGQTLRSTVTSRIDDGDWSRDRDGRVLGHAVHPGP